MFMGLTLSNCCAEEGSLESFGQQEIKPEIPKGNESWIYLLEELMLKL